MSDNLRFVDDAVNIVKTLEARGACARIIGAIAIRLHCPGTESIFQEMNRPITDIDLVAPSGSLSKATRYFEDNHYKLVFGLTGPRRIFQRPDGLKVDVFLDKLEMCHTINFDGRWNVDSPTIPLAELVLEKSQIVKINEKDIKDLLVLFLSHELSDGDKDTINSKHIAGTLSKDWGFYYTVTMNLDKVLNLMSNYGGLDNSQRQTITRRVTNLRQEIEKHPKTLAWKIRARAGTKKKWYGDVEDYE